MISEIEAKPLDLRVKCEPDETNSESDDAEDIKPIYKGYKKCIIKQFRKSCTRFYNMDLEWSWWRAYTRHLNFANITDKTGKHFCITPSQISDYIYYII